MTLYNILKSKIFTIAIVLVIAWLGLSVTKVRTHSDSLKARQESLSDKADSVEKDNERLAKEIEYGKNPLFLEKEARIKLNLKSADENVFFVYATETPIPASTSLGQINFEITQKSNFRQWIYWLTGL